MNNRLTYKEAKKFFQDIKFYLPIVLIFTTGVGGLWQLIELFIIHPSFIRFFSATQLLADGILVTFILLIALLLFSVVLLSVGFISIHYEKIDIGTKPKSKLEHFYIYKSKQSKIKFRGFCDEQLELGGVIAISFITFILIVGFLKQINELEALGFALWLFFSLFFLIFTIHAYVTRWICSKNSIIKSIKNIKPLAKIFMSIHITSLFLISMIAILFIPFIIYYALHINYIFPNNLVNSKNIDKKINFQDYNTSRLIYTNDKYIFIEHIDKNNSKKIEVMKLDVLFD